MSSTLGLFQLENLILTRTQFCFLDLRDEKTRGKMALRIPTELQKTLAQAKVVAVENLESFLQENRIAPTSPVVLICQKGKVSGKVARKLESSGFLNVYTIARGIEGLLSDFSGAC